MYRFGTFKYTRSGSLYSRTADLIMALLYSLALDLNFNENVQSPVDCEAVTKYSVILFINLAANIVEFMQ